MSEDKKYYIVDDNGEIKDVLNDLHSYTILETGDMVVRKGTIAYLKDSVDINFNFIKVNSNVPDEFFVKYPILLILMKNIEYMTNILAHSNGKIIKLNGISKLCGISQSTAKRHIKNMIADDIIHKVKVDGKIAIMINPFLCYKGKRVAMSTHKEFKNSSLARYGEVKERKGKKYEQNIYRNR